MPDVVGVVRGGLLSAREALDVGDLRFKYLAIDSIDCNIKLVNGEVETMTVNSDFLAAVRTSRLLINRINLGNGLCLITSFILIVASRGVIIK